MEIRISKLVDEVKELYADIGKTSSQAYQFKKQGKKGYAQSCMIRVKYLHRKLLSLKQELKSLINGNIAFITYEVTTKQNVTKTLDAILTNTNNDDIYTILKLYCDVNELKFNKILEIKWFSTKLG